MLTPTAYAAACARQAARPQPVVTIRPDGVQVSRDPATGQTIYLVPQRPAGVSGQGSQEGQPMDAQTVRRLILDLAEAALRDNPAPADRAAFEAIVYMLSARTDDSPGHLDSNRTLLRAAITRIQTLARLYRDQEANAAMFTTDDDTPRDEQPAAPYQARLPLIATLQETTRAGIGVWRVDGDGLPRFVGHFPGDVPEWLCFGCAGRTGCLHLQAVWAAVEGQGAAE